VPVITLYEVYKRICQQRSEKHAMEAMRFMQSARVAYLDAILAVKAARLSMHYRIPMADSIILATSQTFNATLWTQDAHFNGLPGVRYRQKGGSSRTTGIGG